MKMFFNHYFHLVTVSPWPILSSFSAFVFMVGSIMMFSIKDIYLVSWGGGMILICSWMWWRDIIREGTFQGAHLKKVINGLKLGMILFILSELLFFISFFWTFFHSSLSPNIEIGGFWPPMNIMQFNPYEIPFFNTIILLSSGGFVTWSHYSILNKNKENSYLSLLITIILGGLFTLIQFYEYKESSFSLSDSIFGSIFFMTTGFHGIHVIVGTIFLIVILVRLKKNHLSSYHHFGFEAATWYWHFVDVIWIFVYSLVYWWHYYIM